MGNVVLGVSGSVAAYRAADLARELMRAGFTVRVCLTDAAQQFVTPILFESLTGQPCLQDTFEEPERGRMAHIDWARTADVLLIAPATATTLNKLAAGVGEDMLTTLALAYEGPIVVAPAMNPSMYGNEATQSALRVLAERGVQIVEPAEGDVACGEQGQGKLASTAAIVGEVIAMASRRRLLAGKKVLITSGPTREPIDGVRYISNRSSGKMGAALARAALLLGADVSVVSGPSSAPLPLRASVIRVETASEMLTAALPVVASADIVVGAAAVADYHVESPLAGKMRRSEAGVELKLVPNPDVIKALAATPGPAGRKVIGFAAEPSADLDVAREKIAAKGLDAIAVNDVSRGDIGFDAEQNELCLIFADGRQIASGKMSKLRCALWLLEQVQASLP
jgi:phosphopantothenoylcysteine decarboxylase / phosphopantothenate---cysteine ligase